MSLCSLKVSHLTKVTEPIRSWMIPGLQETATLESHLHGSLCCPLAQELHHTSPCSSLVLTC